MKILYCLSRLVLIIMVIQLSAFCINCAANSDEEKIEEIARNFISDVNKNNINGILEIISDKGLLDYDMRITKEEIKVDLENTNSHLYKYLYKALSDEDIKLCKEKFNNELYASPYAFYQEYGDNYSVVVSKVEKSEDHYTVLVKGNTEGTDGCLLKVWFLTFKKENDQFYLERNFYP